jgi:glucosylceramidase
VRLGALSAIASAALSLGACSSARHGSAPGAVAVIQTDAGTSQRMARLPGLRFAAGPVAGLPVIHVEDAVRFQRVTGVGAAVTDSSAWLLQHELPASTRAAVMARLFGAGGIRLSAALVPIGASDFTRDGNPYSYDDDPPGGSDPGLSHFSVAHDDAYLIPVLREMVALRPHVAILASEWSPPAWMKANHRLNNLGGRGTLLPGADATLARYLVRFLEAYARRGIPIGAIAPQNEPGQQTVYPGLNLTEPQEARLIAGYLAPALGRAGLHPAIYGHDFKWLFWHRAAALATDPSAGRVLGGIAWHCYDGNPEAMSALHRLAPRLDEVESECSPGSAPGPSAELMIASFRNWASSVLLWNLALDPSGGPVQPPNFGCPRCTGVVTVDTRSRTVAYTEDFYELGQFSAFVAPGARRIASEHFVTYNTRTHQHRVTYASPGLDDVAFVNPDGGLVLLAHNSAPHAAARFAVEWHGRAFRYTLPAGATVTFTWR